MPQYDGSLRLGSLYDQFATGDEPPSTYAITAWVKGEPGGFTRTIGVTVIRALFIAPGMYLGGVRGSRVIWGGAFGASVSITLGIAALKLLSTPDAPQIAENATMVANSIGHAGRRR